MNENRDTTGPTHGALVRKAASWLRGRPGNCRIVLNDVRVTAIQEQPDVIGWRGNGDSVLIECKATKADLRVDRHKPWRRDPSIGMGRLRWLFISEEAFRGTGRNVGYDSIGADWGIAYWSGKGAPRVVRRPGMRARTEVNLDAERVLIVQALIRATEGWGRQMFFEDGDPGPRFTTIMRSLRKEVLELRRQVRQRIDVDAPAVVIPERDVF
jgi:hypothetical protein